MWIGSSAMRNPLCRQMHTTDCRRSARTNLLLIWRGIAKNRRDLALGRADLLRCLGCLRQGRRAGDRSRHCSGDKVELCRHGERRLLQEGGERWGNRNEANRRLDLATVSRLIEAPQRLFSSSSPVEFGAES